MRSIATIFCFLLCSFALQVSGQTKPQIPVATNKSSDVILCNNKPISPAEPNGTSKAVYHSDYTILKTITPLMQLPNSNPDIINPYYIICDCDRMTLGEIIDDIQEDIQPYLLSHIPASYEK